MLGASEADWIRWVGVGAGVVGAGVAAQDGVLLVLRAARTILLGLGQIKAILVHVPFLRRLLHENATVPAVTGQGSMQISKFRTSGQGSVWNLDAPVNARLELLHDQLKQVRADIQQARQKAVLDDTQLRQELTERQDALEAAQQKLRQSIRARERRSARVDFRGVLLVGLSILMTGIPDGLARWSWLGIVFIVLAIAGTVVIVGWVWADEISEKGGMESTHRPRMRDAPDTG